jgi:MFS family permease
VHFSISDGRVVKYKNDEDRQKMANLPAPSVDHQMTTAAKTAGVREWLAFAILMLAMMFAFVDRQVLLLASEPIRGSLGLSDFQLGLLQGTGVALAGALVTYPLGWLADRYDRRWILAGCVAVWSASVFTSGLMQSFEGLMIFTALAGAGEAGLTPIFYTVIPLLFLGKDRQLANSLVAITAAGGGAIALLLASEIFVLAQHFKGTLPYAGAEAWRAGFTITSMAAIILIPAILMTRLIGTRSAKIAELLVSLPDERGSEALDSLTAFVRRHWSLLSRFVLGGAFGGFAFAAVAVWTAVIATRTFGQTPSETGKMMGTILLVSTALAFLLNLAFTRIVYAKKGDRVLMIGISISFLCASLILLALPFVKNLWALYLVYGTLQICTGFASMSYPTALQGLSPDHLRGRMTAINFLIFMLLASMAAPLVGLVSDRLFGADPKQLLTAVALVACPAAMLTTLLYYSCLRSGFMETLADVTRRAR